MFPSDFTIRFAFPNTNNAQCFRSIPQIIIVGQMYVCVFFFQLDNNIDLKVLVIGYLAKKFETSRLLFNSLV